MTEKTSRLFQLDRRGFDSDFEDYLEEQFNRYTLFLQEEVPELSEGFEIVIKPSESKTFQLTVSSAHRKTNVVIKPLAGSGSYTFKLALPENRRFDNKEGDKIDLFFASVGSTNPTIDVVRQDGTVIFTKTYDGSGTDTLMKTFVSLDDQWQV